jgi:hypothetical protein
MGKTLAKAKTGVRFVLPFETVKLVLRIHYFIA